MAAKTEPQSAPAANHFLNRELSWLEFNGRVLEEAADRTLPLLERLKFIAIFSNNLDEFFMVRVAGLHRQVDARADVKDPLGLTPAEQLRRIRRRVQMLLRRQQRLLAREILPGLAAQGLGLRRLAELSPAEAAAMRQHFMQEVMPVLTPVAVDPSHPFPLLASGILELAVSLRRPGGKRPLRAFVEVPRLLPRFIPVHGRRPREGGGGNGFVPLEELILGHLGELFPGMEILHAFPFRITRDMDFSLDEEGAADLLKVLTAELRHRRRREPIRLELPCRGGGAMLPWLLRQLNIEPAEVYEIDGWLQLADFFAFVEKVRRPALLDPEWPPLPSPLLEPGESLFAAIRRNGSLPLFHPYEAFDPVVRLLEEAAADPSVLAIKQTLYRVSGDSPVIRSLQRAAENGKQVTVIVEVRARFDEERNIQWAHSLEQSGVHVIYGVVGLKIHCKALLIVRREEGHIRRYVHLATGNYNDRTARVYTDIGVFLADPDLCLDVASLFNVMTGLGAPPAWRKIAAAPFNLRQTFLELIDREARLSTPQHPGRIAAKVNSLVDPEIIDHLVAAARAGVRVELVVRGICCLRPGVDDGGNIRVVSVVDRFLEHSRIYRFANGGNPEYWLSSADWMPRNLDRRVELLFPVEDPAARGLLDALLQFPLADRRKGRTLLPDGHYTVPRQTHQETRSQRRTYELFRARLAAAQAPAPPPKALQPHRGPNPG
ncbi:MAG: polyphosphate kinase 1 [Lentisphaeria bacterium]